MTDPNDIDTIEREDAAGETADEQTDDMATPDEIALVAFQGLLSAGMDPQAAGVAAWVAGVPAYYAGREQYAMMAYSLGMADAEQPTLPGVTGGA